MRGTLLALKQLRIELRSSGWRERDSGIQGTGVQRHVILQWLQLPKKGFVVSGSWAESQTVSRNPANMEDSDSVLGREKTERWVLERTVAWECQSPSSDWALLLICSFCFPIRGRHRDRDREYIINFFRGTVLWFWANNWLAFPRMNTCWLILLVEEPGWGLRYTSALSLVRGAGQVAGDHPLGKPFSTLSHPRVLCFVMTILLSWNKIDSINYRPHTQFKKIIIKLELEYNEEMRDKHFRTKLCTYFSMDLVGHTTIEDAGELMGLYLYIDLWVLLVWTWMLGFSEMVNNLPMFWIKWSPIFPLSNKLHYWKVHCVFGACK